jgi:tetratricopeptide (TPR) repeat protein/tRNA A-37 threonylcarbamoyl transferase component Bud32
LKVVESTPFQTDPNPPPTPERGPYWFLESPTNPGELGRLGRYHIQSQLGRGGMAEVYRAWDSSLERVVAIKILRPDLHSSPEMAKRFLREARALATLSHPHIVPIYDVGVVGEVPYLVMQFLEGEPLQERLRREGKLPILEVVRVGRETAEGLAAIHAAGLVHRDIKPANLFLERPHDRVKILDFGLVGVAAEESARLTLAGVVMGTPSYMSPEQVRGDLTAIGPSADLFSLGAVLYCAATGALPFAGSSQAAMLAILHENPPPPHVRNPEVPSPLSGLIMRLLAKDLADRYRSAREVQIALDWLTETPGESSASIPGAAVAEATGGTRTVGLSLPAVRSAAAARETVPTLELTFAEVSGRPWRGRVTPRFRGRVGRAFPIAEGLTPQQRQELRWYVEEYLDLPEGGNAVRARQVEESLTEHGQTLRRAVDNPFFEAWLEAVVHAGAGRLVLRGARTDDEVIFRTPWELLRVGAGGGVPLHQLNVAVVRQVTPGLPATGHPDTSEGLRVLAVVSRPEGVGFLDPRYTPEAIVDAFADRPEARVSFCRPPTLPALVHLLEEARTSSEPYHVVHFDGHGVTAEGGVGALCFEDEQGKLDLVHAEQLGTLLAGFRIPLVVLSACRTAARVSAEGTVASSLIRQGVGTVLAMGYAVHVDTDRNLTAAFYEGVARGQSLGAALQSARKQIHANPRRRLGTGADTAEVALQDWFVPQLYQAGDDPVLLPRTPRSRKKTPAPPPGNLPPPPRAGFQGRGQEMHRLERALWAHRVVVLHGPGGMGKTALATEAARWWTRTGLFPDGAVFISFEDAPSPDAVVSRAGEALEGLKFHQRKKPRARLAELLAERRCLVLWDNFESVLSVFGGKVAQDEYAELARSWTAGGSRLLLSCRDRETGLVEAWPFALGELSVSEGLLLLVCCLERLGLDRAGRERAGLTAEALQQVVQRLGGHPLALELVAPALRDRRPDEVLAELGTLLTQAEQAHPEGRNRSLRASLQFSLRHLSADAQKALPAVALLAGGALESLAQRVTGLPPEAWTAVRTELERTGLVRVDGPILRPHPILGEVAELKPAPEQQQRFLSQVVGLCAAFDRQVRSSDPGAALAMLEGCESPIRRALDFALAAGDRVAAGTLAGSLERYLQLRGRGGEAASVTTALRGLVSPATDQLTELSASLERDAILARASEQPGEACQTLENMLQRLERVTSWDSRHERALTLGALGCVVHEWCQRPAEALPRLQQAESLFKELEEAGRCDSANRSAVLGDRANALADLGLLDEALAVSEEALALEQQRGDVAAAARSLGRLGHVLQMQGRYQEADARYREALAGARTAGDEELLGLLAQHRGNLALDRSLSEEAFTHLREALAAFQRARDERGQMQVLNSLGGVDYQRGNQEAALAWFEKGLELAGKLQDVQGQAAVRSNRAAVYAALAAQSATPGAGRQRLQQAIAEERAALALKQQLGQPAATAVSQSNLADYLRRAGLPEEAEQQARSALELFEKLRHPLTWRALLILEQLAEGRGDVANAALWRQRKQAARAEAEQRAGSAVLPRELVASLLQVAEAARRQGISLERALGDSGAPEGFLNQLGEGFPWLVAHLQALSSGAPRPADEVPVAWRDLLAAAWQPVGG